LINDCWVTVTEFSFTTHWPSNKENGESVIACVVESRSHQRRIRFTNLQNFFFFGVLLVSQER